MTACIDDPSWPAPRTPLRLDGHVTPAADVEAPVGRRRLGRDDLFDGAVVAAVAVLVTVAAIVGRHVESNGESIHAGAPPLQGLWDLRAGIGTVLAPLLALVVVTVGVRWTRQAHWSALWPVTWAVSAAWGLAVAWVDPWARGVTEPLLSRYDYLIAVPRINELSDLTTSFTASIPIDSAEPWPTHVASHPPGALLPFVLLERLGLEGAGPAAALIVIVGASTSVALLVAARALLDLDAARRLAPFAMLAPGVIWTVVSADAIFTAIVAWAVALTAVACTATGRRADVVALAAGIALGIAIYMSYGMVLASVMVGAVLLLRGRWRTALLLASGALVVAVVVTAAGFWWLDGYRIVVERYYDGLGGVRPLSYWGWANLAAFALAIGPAAVVGVRRAVSARNTVVMAVSGAALLCIAIATVGGLSKGEVERIWLPFGVWVVFAAVAIPADRTRVWLAAQAALVIGLAHVVLTPW